MEPIFQVVIGHVLPLLLPSIMNCLLSKLEELLTNKYSGLISDQQNNKWRRWNNTLQQSQGKALNPKILMITKLHLKLCNVIKTSKSLSEGFSPTDTLNQTFSILCLYLIMPTDSHALGVQIQMQEGANCCNKLNILTFIMNSNNLLWYHFP